MEDRIYINDLSYPIEQEKKCLVYRLFGQVPARLVLYLLSWSGFLVSFMMRNDINMAIVAMVAEPDRGPTQNLSQYCYTTPADALGNGTSQTSSVAMEIVGTLQWSARVQSYVLASFYWAYIVSQVVGGVATQRLGTKRVFGYAQLATALCSLCIPEAAHMHWALVIALRCVQGFASGLTWPAMYALVGHWIPTTERSRFMSSFQGFSIGIGITYPLAGFLIHNLGWKSVFYTTGSIGVLWCIIWYLLAFDSPEEHPRISLKEQTYIRENRDNSNLGANKKATSKVPWWDILKSKPCWAIGITTFGRIWVHYVFIITGPKYMKQILGFSIEKNGLLTGFPFLCSYLASVLFCYIADKLTGVITLTSVRKIMTFSSQVLPGLLVVLLGHLGCELWPVLTVWFLAITLITASYAGAMANIVDLAPNYAGPVLAFAQTIHMTASFLSPLVALHILDGRERDIAAWREVFYLTGGVACLTYIVYQVWGTAHVQAWNDAKNGEQEQQEPMIAPLKDASTK